MENYLEFEAKFHEKTAAKKTANKVGMGTLLFLAFKNVALLIFSFLVIFIPGLHNLAKDSVFNCLFSAFISIFGFILCGLFAIKLQKRKVSEIIEFKKPKKYTGWLLLVGMGVCMLANVITGIIGSLLPFEPVIHEVDAPTNLSGIVIYFITTSVVPAFVEEFFYRGVVYGSFKKFGKMVAIVISSVLFSLIHGNLVQIPFAFVVGLILSFITAEASSIWPAIIIHFLNNFMACTQTYVRILFGDEISSFYFLVYGMIFVALGLISIVIYATKVKNNAFKLEKTPHVTSSGGLIKHILFSASNIVFYVYVIITVLQLQIAG